MNRYSKILHHITPSDMRNTHAKKLAVEKIQEDEIIEDREYVQDEPEVNIVGEELNPLDLKEKASRLFKKPVKKNKLFGHIGVSDMRKSHTKKLDEKKIKAKEVKYIKDQLEILKFDWRSSLNEKMGTGDVFSYSADAQPDVDLTVIDATLDASFGVHPDGVAAHGYSANGLQGGTVIRDSGTGTGSDGGFNIGKHLAFTGDTYYNLRWAALNPIDASALDTIVITAIRGNDVNGGEDPDAANEDLEVWYRTKDMAQNGWRGINITPDGTTVSGVERKIIPIGSDSSGLRDWSLNLPAHVRTPETQFMLIQTTSSGAQYDHYGVTEIKFRRNTPLNVVVPLDSPEAISFVRVGSNEGDPKKRKKKVEDQLKASKEYTDKVLGSDFPGMGATLDDTKQSPIGKDQVAQAHKDAGTLSQQLKKALGKDSDVTEPTSKSTVDTIKKVSKDGGKTIQYQQTDDITGEPIEKKPEVIATRQSVIATDSDGNEIKPKPVGAGAVQGADATNLDQQEPTESEPTESEPPTDLDQEDAEVEKEAELTDDEKEELKNQGKSEEEIKQEEQNKKDQAKLDNKSNALQKLLDSVIGDVTNDLNGFKNLAKVAKFVVQGFFGMLAIADRLNPFTDNSTTNNDLQGGLSVILNSLDIAVSVMDGEVKKSNPTAAQIQSYKDSILPDLFKSSTKHLIPISDVRHEYADANIYVERIDGKAVVRDNTGGVRQDLTDKDTHGSVGGEYAGFGHVGGGYSQLVIPKDGGEPRIHYYDYNYENINNPSDVSYHGGILEAGKFDANTFMKSLSNIIHQLRPSNTKLNLPVGVKSSLVGYLTNFQDLMGTLKTTSTLDGWPPGIHGAALTDITIPLSKLPKETQDMIKAHPLSWTEERISKMTDDQVWDQLSFETAEDVKWFDDNFEKLMEKYHPELYKNNEKWKEVDGKLSDITKQPEYTAAGDAAKEYVETVKENYKELIANVEKEIPLPEGDYPEWNPSSDPDLEAQKEVTTKAWSTYQQKWDEALPAMDAYDAHAATLEKKGNMLHGTFQEIEELKRLESEMNALLDVWDKASDAWNSSLQREGKLFSVYMKKLEKERKPWDDVYKKRQAAEDKIIAERDVKVEAARKAHEDTYLVRKGQGGKLLNGGDWTHPETGKVIPGMHTIRDGLEKEKDELGQLMLLEQRAYGETLMKEQKAWIWKTRYSGFGDGKSWTPKGGSGGSGGSGKGKPKPQNRYDTRRSQLALDEPIVRDDQQNSYKPRGTFMQETTFDRIKKMRKNFDYEGKPSPDGFPENDPPELDPKTGMHPRYGKNANRYKKLDPVSARSMPKTGDPETDAEVAKAAKKPK